MSYGHSGGGQQSRTSASGYQSSYASSSEPQSPEWSTVTDPVERRKIQNKLAQQRFTQGLKRENKKRTQNATQQTINKQRAPTRPQKRLNSRTITHSQAFHGEGYPSDILWQRDKTKNEALSKAHARTQFTLCDQEGAAGNDPALGLRLTDRFARGHTPWGPFGTFPQRFSVQDNT